MAPIRVATIPISSIAMFPAYRRWRRRQTAASFTVDEATWRRVESRLPFLEFLESDQTQRLRALTLEFLAEKEIAGARGLQVDNDMRLTIGLQACLPILNLGLDAYDDWVGIVVYPGDFVIPRNVIDEAGVVHEYDDPVLGEAWPGGPVVISWFEQTDQTDGINVVLHEFAHKLDMRGGEADGMPQLAADMSAADWARCFSDAYADFCGRTDQGEDTLLDPYATESPAEFFAVMSEAFFETPVLLQEEYPEIYAQLARYYRLDPATGERRLGEAGHA